MSYKKSKEKSAPAKFIPQIVGGLAGAGGALLAGEGLGGAVKKGIGGFANPIAGVGNLAKAGIEKATEEKPVAQGTQPVTQAPVDPNIAGGGIANEYTNLTEEQLIANQTGIKPGLKKGELKQNSSYNSNPVFNTSAASKMKGYYKKK
jgi:hypothetical protein